MPTQSKAQKLREVDQAELNLRAAELQKDLFDLRLRLTTKEQQDTSVVRDKRREYARIQTILNQKKNAA